MPPCDDQLPHQQILALVTVTSQWKTKGGGGWGGEMQDPDAKLSPVAATKCCTKHMEHHSTRHFPTTQDGAHFW